MATYIESATEVTKVTNADRTRDDIRTYTAGIAMVLDQQVPTRLKGDTVAIHIDLTAQVNPTGLRKRSLRFETMRAV